MKSIGKEIEPLKVHRYIVAVGQTVKPPRRRAHWHTYFRYAANKKEVAEHKRLAPKGAFISVYEAKHKFLGCWEK